MAGGMGWYPLRSYLTTWETGAFDPRSQVVQFGHRLASGEIGLKHSGQIAGSPSAAGGLTLAMSAFIGLMTRKKMTRAMIRKAMRELMNAPYRNSLLLTVNVSAEKSG